MQAPTVVSAPSEVAELLNQAMSQGRLVILRTTPASPNDPRTPLLIALNQLFKLTLAEGRALVELMEHGYVSREALHTATSPDGNPVSKIKVIDVIICTLRRKLNGHGIKIVTVYRLVQTRRGCRRSHSTATRRARDPAQGGHRTR